MRFNFSSILFCLISKQFQLILPPLWKFAEPPWLRTTAMTDGRHEHVGEPAVSEQTALPSITAFCSD